MKLSQNIFAALFYFGIVTCVHAAPYEPEECINISSKIQSAAESLTGCANEELKGLIDENTSPDSLAYQVIEKCDALLNESAYLSYTSSICDAAKRSNSGLKKTSKKVEFTVADARKLLKEKLYSMIITTVEESRAKAP